MKSLLLILSLTAIRVFAHPGHPGPEIHGDATHIMVGFITALPLLAGTAWLLRERNRRRAAIAVRRDTNQG